MHSISPWRKRIIAACVAVTILSWAAVLWGAEPAPLTLVAPEEAQIGRPFEVSVEGLQLPLSTFQSAPPQITWLVLGGEAQVRQRMELVVTMDSGGKPVWSASPYVSVTASAVQGEKLYVVLTFDEQGKFSRQASLGVTLRPFPKPDPEPDPEPDPKPDPNPQPNPEPGKRWVILIEETDHRQLHPGLSDFITSPTFQAYLTSKGHQFRDWDPTPAQTGSVPAEAKYWLDRAGDKLPVLFIYDEKTRKILYQGDPPSAKAAVEFLQKYGG